MCHCNIGAPQGFASRARDTIYLFICHHNICKSAWGRPLSHHEWHQNSWTESRVVTIDGTHIWYRGSSIPEIGLPAEMPPYTATEDPVSVVHVNRLRDCTGQLHGDAKTVAMQRPWRCKDRGDGQCAATLYGRTSYLNILVRISYHNIYS